MSYQGSLYPAAKQKISQQMATWWDEAERAVHGRQVPRARRFLRWILAAQPDDEEAWLWLARLAATPQARSAYLRQALAFHPTSERIAAALREARAQQLEAAAHELSPRPAALRCLPDQRRNGFNGAHQEKAGFSASSCLLLKVKGSRLLSMINLF